MVLRKPKAKESDIIPCRNQADLLSAAEKDVLHRNILRILAEIGLQVEHDGLLGRLGDAGWPVDLASRRVRFPAPKVEAFLARLPKVDWDRRAPRIVVRGDTFSSSYYVDPFNDEIRDWTPKLFDQYMGLIRRLPGIESYYLMGCPWAVSSAHEPIHERLNAWRIGVAPCKICKGIYEKVPTIYGPVSLRTKVSKDGKTLDLVYSAKFRQEPKKVVLHVPPMPGLKTVKANGKKVTVNGGKVVLE